MTTTTQPASSTTGQKTVSTVSHLVLSFWTVLIIVPLLWTLMSSFKTSREIFASPFTLPAQWNFDNYVSAWTTAGIGRYFANTVIVVGFALVIVMVLGSMCAYVLARFNFIGSRAHLLPDARRADVPGLPRHRPAVLRAPGTSAC